MLIVMVKAQSIAVAVAIAWLPALAGGCETRVVSERMRPVTVMPGGSAPRHSTVNSQPSQDKSWWDELFGADDTASQPTTPNASRTSWLSNYRRAHGQSSTPSSSE